MQSAYPLQKGLPKEEAGTHISENVMIIIMNLTNQFVNKIDGKLVHKI